MALAQDEATGAGRGRVVDATTRNQGLTVYRSNFSVGLDNWIDHWDYDRPWPIISRTEYAAHVGSHSLMISTGEHASPPAGDVSNSSAAYKRMSRFQDYRYHSFSGYFALGIGGYSGSWASWGLSIDTQSFDNTQRSFYKLQCQATGSPGYSKWRIRGDGGDSDWKDVPSSTHVKLGDNDNKVGFNYVRLTVDTQANGGLGGYHQLQVNRFVASLTGLGAGSSLEAPQNNGTDAVSDFNGGYNIGINLARETTQAGGCQLYADDIVFSVSNTAPATA